MQNVKLGDAGYPVLVLQSLLSLHSDIEVTGSFGEETQDVLCEYQARYAIVEGRGTATPETWSQLLLENKDGVL
jgi:hypothetical protein